MEILPNNNIIDNYRDTSIMEQKVNNLKDKDDKNLMEVCKEFESVFIHMMLKEMKKTVPEDGFIEKSQGTRIFEDMYLEELSKEMSKGNGMGIAQMMYNQFKNGGIKL